MTIKTTSTALEGSDADPSTGYRAFTAGPFRFWRDEYFAHVDWEGGTHVMPADAFLRALMRDIAWGFFYGTVNFDEVLGTTNHYGEVDLFVGACNEAYKAAGRDLTQRFKSDKLMELFKSMLDDWTNEGFDPFASPQETGAPWGKKHGSNKRAIERKRVTAKRMVGLPNDTPRRSDEAGQPVNRHFHDVPQDQPIIEAEPGFESEVSAYNLFAYLSRSDVTWNPSVCSIVGESLYCPTTEEFILPIDHGNDRVEWFMQLSDEILWRVRDRDTGKPRAMVLMRAGDIAAMPADISHRGFSTKRSMLLVWENASPKIPDMIRDGKAPKVPVTF